MYLNFWLVKFLVDKFFGRGISCRYIFGSWWLVVGRGGSCVVLETTVVETASRLMRKKRRRVGESKAAFI